MERLIDIKGTTGPLPFSLQIPMEFAGLVILTEIEIPPESRTTFFNNAF